MAQHALTDTFVEIEATQRYPQLRAAMRAASGAWVREASLALALAAQAGVTLDEATLIYADVRDLLALQQTLRKAPMR